MLRQALLGCALLLTVALPAPVGAQDTPLVPPSVMQEAHTTGLVRVLVRLAVRVVPEGDAPGDVSVSQQRADIASAQDTVLQQLRGVGHVVHRRYETFPFLAIEASVDALRLIEAMRGLVMQVEEDVLERPGLAQSGPLVGAPTVWNSGFDGTGIVVGIIDTGVASTHAFLAGKVVAEACFSSTSPTSVTLCANGAATQFGPGAAAPCPLNGCTHGTHVAGIAVGGGSAFSGIAKGARLIAVKVFSRVTSAAGCAPESPPCARAFRSDSMQGLEYIFQLRTSFNIAAANLSLGAEPSTTFCDNDPRKPAIDNLRSVGIATVVSSGNDGAANAVSAPACISTAVSVGATTKQDAVPFFSNTASFLSLLAPGSSINSSVPGGGFALMSGTSMAAPHVTGAFAILRQASPTASVGQILQSLQVTGLPVNDPGAGIIKPRIRIDQALTFLVGGVRSFVAGFYTQVLARSAEPAGLAFWTSHLESNCNPGGANTLADAFFDSPEFRTNRALTLNGLVTVLYRTFLNRDPEASGLGLWAASLREARVNIAVSSFISSSEFRNLLPDRTNANAVRTVVSRFYVEVLGRNPETAGLNGWVNAIVATGDLEGAARSFLVSPEFEGRALTFRGYLRILYRAFLGREPDPGGLDFFEAILRGHLLNVIHAGFTPSPEFQNVIGRICS